MKLNSSQLEAFVQVANTLNFTQAALKLHVTQSALSQRIAKLEEEMEITLFTRDRSSVKLTEAGLKLLRHCQLLDSAEEGLLSELKSSELGLAGVLRIAGFSSVNRSLVIPAFKSLMVGHGNLSMKLMTREIHELEDLLKRSEVDYIVTSRKPNVSDLESVLLGYEENVLVRSKKFASSLNYLDHDEADQTTKSYFKRDWKKAQGMRYLDDVYGLIDGVRNGYGQAVLPRHLIQGEKDLEVIGENKVLKIPVYLQYYRQPYYRPGHVHIVEALVSYFKEQLSVD